MTPEQKAAYVMAQAALLNAKVASMQAENAVREQLGYAEAYGVKEWEDVLEKAQRVIGHNAIIKFFES